MSEERRLEEKIISQAVQRGVSSQLDDATTVEIDIRTDLLKAVQGTIDSIAVSGQDVTAQDIHVQSVDVSTTPIDVNLWSVLFGKPELNHPIDATARVSLTEADINQAVNAPAIANRIPPLQLNVDGETVTVTLQHPLDIQLPARGKIALTGSALLAAATTTRAIQFSVVIVPQTEAHPVLLEMFQCQPGNGLSIDLIIALMQKFKELLALPYITFEGIALQVKTLDVQPGSLTVEIESHIPKDVLL